MGNPGKGEPVPVVKNCKGALDAVNAKAPKDMGVLQDIGGVVIGGDESVAACPNVRKYRQHGDNYYYDVCDFQ
jgi:hypothetical protein